MLDQEGELAGREDRGPDCSSMDTAALAHTQPSPTFTSVRIHNEQSFVKPDVQIPMKSCSVDTATQIYKEFQILCSRLAKLGHEALVLCSSPEELVMQGTSHGTAFVSQEPDLVRRFQKFCQERKEEFNATSNTSEAVDGNSVNTNLCHSQVEENSMHVSDIDDIPEEEEEEERYNNDDGDEDYLPGKESVKKSKRMTQIKQKDHGKRKASEGTVSRNEHSYPTIGTRNTSKRAFKNTKEVKENETVKRTYGAATDIKVEATPLLDSVKSSDENETLETAGRGHGIAWKLGDFDVVTPETSKLTADISEHEILSCFRCVKECSSIGRLREHVTKVHKLKIGYACRCGKLFSTKEGLERHVADSQNFTCDQCQAVFCTEKQVKVHILERHKEQNPKLSKKYPCEKCGSGFEYEHFLTMHNSKFPDCDKTFSNGKESKKELFKEEMSFTENGREVTKPMSELLAAQTKIPYRCLICKQAYNRKANFTRHMMTHLSGAANICIICGLKFRGKESLTRHMKEHLIKPYNCGNCRARYATKQELKDHEENICRGEKMRSLMCKSCDYTAPSRSALDKHASKHTGYRPYTCNLCGKCLLTACSLERHMAAIHEETRPYSCDQCDKSFKTKDAYKKHQKTHREPKFHCEICGKSCTEMGNLKKHMMVHTKERPYVCEICGKAYGRKSLMENHRRTHTGEKPFVCYKEGCGKGFRSYSNLKQHIRSHSQTHPYVCDICGRQFKQPGRLNHHRKDHLIDYRWPCAYCQEKFKSLFIYKGHLAKFHPEMRKEIEETTNIRLYECSLCPKVYGDKEDLTRHIYIHTGEKPFSCQYCHKAFNDKSNMKQHEKIHTGDRRFACPLCGKAFIHNKTLRLHLKTCHNKVPEPAMVTEVSLTEGMERGLVRLENLPPAKLTEPGDKLDDKHSIENVLKTDFRNEAAASGIQMIQTGSSRLISVEPAHTLLEPLMIIENF